MRVTNREAAFERALGDLERLLSGGRFLTAVQIAVEMECSKPVAHKRLRVLRERGRVFQVQRVREGAVGPMSRAFAIVSAK